MTEKNLPVSHLQSKIRKSQRGRSREGFRPEMSIGRIGAVKALLLTQEMQLAIMNRPQYKRMMAQLSRYLNSNRNYKEF